MNPVFIGWDTWPAAELQYGLGEDGKKPNPLTEIEFA
jgi:hypothetical protein